MEFKKYQHLERFGTEEVEGIHLGKCYVFPKLDGTNSSVWLNEGVQAGSRNRQLSLDKDNAGFYAWVKDQSNILEYLKENPTHTLYGEWLVPHSLKTYKDNAWRKFYVFDVVCEAKNIHYEKYSTLLEKHGIDYITPICFFKNGSYDQFIKQLDKNHYLITDGSGVGEGIVIKNYSFENKYGRQIWAKIVTSEFKEVHKKAMGINGIKGKKLIEEEIANQFVTKALCEKVYAKIENESGFSGKKIPQLLNTVYYDVIKEETSVFVKKHKNPIINFNTLQYFVFAKVKEQLPSLF